MPSNRLMIVAVVLGLVGTALAVRPRQFSFQSEADFQPGNFDQTVLTSLGEVQLARAVEELAALSEDNAIIYDLARLPDGQVLLATGPQGKLMRYDPQHQAVEPVAEFPGHQVFSLEVVGEEIYLAISGANSRLERRDAAGQVLQTIALPGVRYVWQILPIEDRLYLATGTEGRVLVVDPQQAAAMAQAQAAQPADEAENGDAGDSSGRMDQSQEDPGPQAAVTDDAAGAGDADADVENDDQGGPAQAEVDDSSDAAAPQADDAADQAEQEDDQPALPGYLTVALDSEQPNVLCLGADGQGRVYAGTDGEGLVYRLTARADDAESPFDVFVMYDAAEPEIGALLVEADGTVYAGTADAEQARPGRMAEALEEQTGRPEKPGEAEVDGDLPVDEPAPEPMDNDQPDGQPRLPDAAPAAADAPEAVGNESRVVGADDTPEPAGPRQTEPPAPPKPSPEQYDRLRQAIRQRLARVRSSGELKVQPMASGPTRSRSTAARRTAESGPAAGARTAEQGNAIYQIQPDGFVREVFRESVMVLRLIRQNGKLLVATGNEGQLYRVDPADGETTVLAHLKPQQIPAMLAVDDQRVMLGTANAGRLLQLTPGYAESGTFTSPVLDAAQISLWGNLVVVVRSEAGTGAMVETRSGNVGDPEAGSWSDWSQQVGVRGGGAGEPAYLKVQSPSARFVQFRVSLTGQAERTPVLQRVALKYLVPNMRPRINTLTARYAEADENQRTAAEAGQAPATRHVLNVAWEAADPNEDALTYELQMQRLDDEPGPFVTITDQIEGDSHEWDTRGVPDGRYVLRLIASDETDNVVGHDKQARRRSATVVVDNSPPEVSEVAVGFDAEAGQVAVTARAADGLSPIVELRYRVDGGQTWQLVLPEDLIYDSTSERFSFNIDDLSPGRHVVALRVTDALGNSRYVSRTVDVR